MKKSYSPEEVAAAHLPESWTDRVRWLKRRLASGEIPGKRLARGVYRMTDEDIEAWLNDRAATPVDTSHGAVSIIDGLSKRSRSVKRQSPLDS